jgi:hypothetical protein
MRIVCLLFAVGSLLCICSCAAHPEAQQARALMHADESGLDCLTLPTPQVDVEAMVVPPIGWVAQPLKHSSRHDHQIWLSPGGSTAYGVIRFKLPWPLSPEAVLKLGFLPEMARTEGEATLLSSERDPSLPGIRFVAQGGKHVIRTNLTTRGFKGWAVYAGTMRDQPVVSDELQLAELARERTTLGLAK